MSWIKENYHIAALGGGALVLAGLGFLGYSGNKSVNETLNAKDGMKKGGGVIAEGGDIADGIIDSIGKAHSVVVRSTSTGRPVQLFTSVDLFEKEGELLDLLKLPKPLHPPIPNQWWVDNAIDPSYSDSPSRDPDGDGFSNLEEFEAKTNPNDAEDYGALISKLEVVSVESDYWLLLFNSVLGDGKFQFNLQYRAFGKGATRNRIPATQAINIGDTFFPNDPGKDFFKLIKIEEIEEETRFGTKMVKWATVEDTRSFKNKATYKIPFGMNRAQYPKFTNYDHRIIFRLNAIGKESENFKIEENGTFSLPVGGEEKNYQLVQVNLEPQGPAVRKVLSVDVKDIKTGETHTIKVPQS